MTSAELRRSVTLPLPQDNELGEMFELGSSFAPARREEIVGIDPILDRLDEVVAWLREPAAYARFGARLEPGILLEGPPGTGKTLVARYLATESRALFVDFAALRRDSGVDPAAVAETFRLARAAHAASGESVLLFWDEFDLEAGASFSHAGPQRSPTAAQLAKELDGVNGKNEGVLLVACTNFAERIDDALLRAGRIGLRIRFAAPDVAGKEQLLHRYLADLRLEDDIDCEALSHLFTSNDPAAAIEEAVTEAWRHAVGRALAVGAEPLLSQSDLIETLVDRLIGPTPAYFQSEPRAHLRTAVHEVGHALVALAQGIPIRLVTVRAGRSAQGGVMTGTSNERGELEEQLAHIRIGFGGMIAEQVAGVGSGTGNGGDTAKATGRAISLVDENGLGRRSLRFNPRALATPMSRPLSEEILCRLDEDAAQLLEDAYEDAEQILFRIGPAAILGLAEILVEQEWMTGSAFEEAAHSAGVCG